MKNITLIKKIPEFIIRLFLNEAEYSINTII